MPAGNIWSEPGDEDISARGNMVTLSVNKAPQDPLSSPKKNILVVCWSRRLVKRCSSDSGQTGFIFLAKNGDVCQHFGKRSNTSRGSGFLPSFLLDKQLYRESPNHFFQNSVQFLNLTACDAWVFQPSTMQDGRVRICRLVKVLIAAMRGWFDRPRNLFWR